jgi:hypothetical protein
VTYFAQDPRSGGWIEHTVAVGALVLIVSVVGYYELFDHRSIADSGLLGGLAHTTLFASLAIYALGVVRFAPPVLICAALALIAAALELFEIVPTAPGTPVDWMYSMTGIGAAWLATHLTRRPRTDTAIAIALILWGCGVICSLQAPSDEGAPVAFASSARP